MYAQTGLSSLIRKGSPGNNNPKQYYTKQYLQAEICKKGEINMSDKNAGLSVWHLTMLALGTVVGGSFFLGSAIAIKAAGPAILISFILGGILVYIVLTALSEMTVASQTAGSFRTFAEQMYGPAIGFVVGWLYWTGLTLAMSSEATAAAVFINAWIPGLSLPAMAAIIIVAVTLLNLIGARTLASLESGLAFLKLSAIIGFIVLAVALISGLIPGKAPVGLGVLRTEPFFPAGLAGIAGSMLIVMFTYAGFEVIGLAASEARDPHRTVPRAILFTILGLVGLYVAAISVLLPLVRTQIMTESVSPLVAGLTAGGFGVVAAATNVILVTAILSTMLAAMFGMGRMVRSLAEAGYAPAWLREKWDIPRRGILFSGAAMLAGVALAFILPSRIYIFLVSSGGFALLFTYVVIMATHYKYRKLHGCPPKGHCQLKGFPFTTLIGLFSLILIILSMPLIPGQGSGLVAGLTLVIFYTVIYIAFRSFTLVRSQERVSIRSLLGSVMPSTLNPIVDMEAGEEIQPKKSYDKISKKGSD